VAVYVSAVFRHCCVQVVSEALVLDQSNGKQNEKLVAANEELFS